MWGNVVVKPLKPTTPLFLKSLVVLVATYSGRITAKDSNTILVDDCPYKFVCNPDECGLFPNAFTNNRVQDADMMKVLLPYFESLYYSPMSDAHDFVVIRRFGQQPILHNDAVKMAVMQSNKFNGPELQPVEFKPLEIVH